MADLLAYCLHLSGEVKEIKEGRHFVGGSVTVQYVDGGTVQYVRGGTVEHLSGASLAVAYRKAAVLKLSDQAVLVERIDGKVKMYTAKTYKPPKVS